MQSLPGYPNDVTIAGGNVLFSTDGTHWEDIGHAKSFKVKVETEEKEHINSRSGLRKVAKTFITKLTASGSIECNYPSKENINKFFMGDSIVETTQNSGSMSDSSFTVQLDKWRYVGKRGLSSVVVKAASTSYSAGTITADVGNGGTAVLNTPTMGASIQAGTYEIVYDTDHYTLEDPDANMISLSKVEGTAVYTSLELGFTVASGTPNNADKWTCEITGTPSTATMALGTDYLLEATQGLIMVLSTNTKGVVDDASVTVSASYAEVIHNRVDAGTKNQHKVHIWFIGDPLGGVKQEVKGYVNLKPSGELGGIAEEEQMFTYDFKFQEHDSYVDADGAKVLFQYYDYGNVG